jgi:succinate dehydrogenase/fumarate reductase cytochrome b subunit
MDASVYYCGFNLLGNRMSEVRIRKIHFVSGITLTIFIGLHLANHVASIAGAEQHINWMNALRHFYRAPIIEFLLLAAVLVQMYSGIRLFLSKRKTTKIGFEKLHIFSGLYMAVFLVIHVSAVLVGRFVLRLDTNYYFGAAGLNSFPVNLFFVPYYGFAILSFFGHVAAIHHNKMKNSIGGLSVNGQSKVILIVGVCVTLLILYGMTNGFTGATIPEEYQLF